MFDRNRCFSCAAAALLILTGFACHPKGVDTDESAAALLSAVSVNSAKAQHQLVNGFYNVEAGAWRWTSGKFTVVLRPPANSATRGATLKFALSIPESVIKADNIVTLAAKVGDTSLPPETYNHTGDYIYTRDVPASALQSDSARVDFSLDKTIPPTGTDQRTLGIVAKQIRLDPK